MGQGDEADWPGYLIKKVQQRVRQSADAGLRDVGLSFAQYVVLRELDASPGASSAELARRCFVTRQSLREILAVLGQQGWTTTAAATTGRVRPVSLTDAGRDRLAAGWAAMAGIEARMVRGLTDGDLATLRALLVVCADNLADADQVGLSP